MIPLHQDDVDEWVQENDEIDASRLLTERLPKVVRKLRRIDRLLIEALAEVREQFPDAEYYTASGGFNLLLGSSHNASTMPQQQRFAWGGYAQISDGDSDA